MKILSEKKSICTSIKVLYERIENSYENYYEDIEKMKKEGWKPVTKPNFYDERNDIIIKSASNGIVITYVKYEEIKI